VRGCGCAADKCNHIDAGRQPPGPPDANSVGDFQRARLQRAADCCPGRHQDVRGCHLDVGADQIRDPEQLPNRCRRWRHRTVPGAADAHPFHRQLRNGGKTDDHEPCHVPDVHQLSDADEFNRPIRLTPASMLGRQQRCRIHHLRTDWPSRRSRRATWNQHNQPLRDSSQSLWHQHSSRLVPGCRGCTDPMSVQHHSRWGIKPQNCSQGHSTCLYCVVLYSCKHIALLQAYRDYLDMHKAVASACSARQAHLHALQNGRTCGVWLLNNLCGCILRVGCLCCRYWCTTPG